MSDILNDKDIDSATWANLKAHYTIRRQTLLEKLAGDLSAEETAKLRGRIRECTDLLKLEDRRPEEEQHTEF